MADPKPVSADPVLIWSMEHDAWWRPNWRGYTLSRAEAGVYTRREAQGIVDGSRGANERIEEIGPGDHRLTDWTAGGTR